MTDATLDFSQWYYDVKFHTNRKELAYLLTEDEKLLTQDEINAILKRFEDEARNEKLWQPKSAKIFCDEKDFAPLDKYRHSKTERLEPNDKNIEWWHTEWKTILSGIDAPFEDNPLSRQHAIRGFINIHRRIRQEDEPLYVKGLRDAINELKDIDEIKKQLPDEYKKWLDENPPKPSDA